MSVSFPPEVKKDRVSSTPANTNEATLYTAGNDNPCLIGLWITNITSTAAKATLKIDDGTAYSLIHEFEIPGNGYLIEPEIYIPMDSGDTIKITSGTASALTFTVIIYEGGAIG